MPVRRHARHRAQAQIKLLQEGDALAGNRGQQPADVVARRTLHRVQTVPLRSLEVTAVHAVIGLEVSDDRLDRLAPFEQLSILLADPLGLASVHDVHIRVVRFYTPIAQIHEHRRGL